MAYLFAAFFILWAITFGYVFSIAARQKRLQRELESLRRQRGTGSGSSTDSLGAGNRSELER